MKINKAKMMVATLAIVAGAATVGSISGTVAWFQYNTRVTAAYVGTTASVSRNLQIRIHDENIDAYKDAASAWKTNLEVNDISDYLTAKGALEDAAKKKGNGSTFSPATFGKAAKDAALPSTGDFANGPKSNPMAGQFAYSQWADSAAGDYITIPFEVKLLNGKGEAMSKPVYLTDLTLQKHSGVDDANDMSTALRVHFSSTTRNQLWAKSDAEVGTSDNLDLDGDGIMDKVRDRYIFSSVDQDSLTDGVYGDILSGEGRVKDPNAKVASYIATGTANTAACPKADDTTAALVTTNAIELGTTNASGILAINTTIWMEGWALLTDYADGSAESAVWQSGYAGVKFDVGMSFAVSNAN